MVQHAAQFAAARHPVHLRSRTGPADVRRRGAARLHWAGDLDRRERVRVRSWCRRRPRLSAQEIASQVEALIVTRGSDGSVIYTRRTGADDPDGEAEGGAGSDGLRRRLSRGPDPWSVAWPGLGDDGTDRFAVRRDQDRIARHAESSLHAKRSSRRGIARTLGRRCRWLDQERSSRKERKKEEMSRERTESSRKKAQKCA